jgi:hypothetical protein
MDLKRALVLVLSFSYRGAPEEYSMKFHFNGAQPASEAGWKTLTDEVWTALKPGFNTSSALQRSYGYEDHPGWDPGEPLLSVSTVDYVNEYGGAVPGTKASESSTPKSAGDQAIYARFPTPKRSTKGKPVYLYSFIHDVYVSPTTAENITAAQRTALLTAFTKLADGSLTNFGKRTTPDGIAVGTPPTMPGYMTTRTLKRRGRRPPTP